MCSKFEVICYRRNKKLSVILLLLDYFKILFLYFMNRKPFWNAGILQNVLF